MIMGVIWHASDKSSLSMAGALILTALGFPIHHRRPWSFSTFRHLRTRLRDQATYEVNDNGCLGQA